MLEPLAQGGIYTGLPAFTAFAKLVNYFSRQSDGDALFGRCFLRAANAKLLLKR